LAFPTGHGVHGSRPSEEYNPDGHAPFTEQVAELMYVSPVGHGMQVVVLMATKGGRQAVHDGEPGLAAMVPITQAVHELEPTVDVVPGTHNLQALEPTNSEYLPDGQNWHVLELSREEY